MVWAFRVEGSDPASVAAGWWLRKSKHTAIAAEASAKLKTTLDDIKKIKEVHQHGMIALLHCETHTPSPGNNGTGCKLRFANVMRECRLSRLHSADIARTNAVYT